MVIFSFPHHCYIYELKILCKEGLSSLILASLTCISMDHKYLFCPWVIIHYQLYYSGCSIGHGGLSCFCVLQCASIFLKHFLTFWLHKVFQTRFLFSPPQPWNQPLLPESLILSSEGMLIATGVPLLLGLSAELGNLCM